MTSDRPIDVVYADSSLLVLDKPSGLLSVPGRGADKQDCLSARVQRHYPDALIVHRLDMATSGLMLMARGADMQRLLSEASANRLIEKHYVAVVDGRVGRPEAGPTEPHWQLIDMPISPDWPNRPRQHVDWLRGRPSRTLYRVLSYDAATATSRLELRLITGRTHQLRVHLQAISHPIIGDQLYAGAEVRAKASRLLLHAATLGLSHPLSGERIDFERAPDPAVFVLGFETGSN